VKRDLVNTACVVSAIAFVATLSYHLITPPPEPAYSNLDGSYSPLESALDAIDRASHPEAFTHNVWHSVAEAIMRTEEPLRAFARFESAIDPELDAKHAISGYSAYYLGYHLAQQHRPGLARRSWEIGVDRFRGTDDVDRPHLAGNDRIYLARTLMRLGRGAEAYEALQGLPGLESATPPDHAQTLVLARTLAEIGHEERAGELIEAWIRIEEETDDGVSLSALLRESARWQRSREPLAHRVALESVARVLLDRFTDDEALSAEDLALVRRTVYALDAHEGGRLSRELLRTAAAAAERAAREEGMYTFYLWSARFCAALGEPSRAADLIKGAPVGSLNPSDIVTSPELIRFLDREDLREAVRRHGEPDEWPEPSPT